MNNEKMNNIYILGTRKKKEMGLLSIGRFYALDGSYGADIFLDATIPHIISIFGKRGYGKSYTLGVLIEELTSVDEEIRNDLSIIIIDTLGIFWTMIYPNVQEKILLDDWKLKPTSIVMNHITPDNEKSVADGQDTHPLSIPAYYISPDVWCDLFQVKPTSPFGISLVESIYHLRTMKNEYHLDDIFEEIINNQTISDDTRQLAINFFHYAQSLGIFRPGINSIEEILKPASINCIDLSCLPSTHMKQVVTGIISELIFQKRIQARKTEEYSLIHKTHVTSSVPKVWMFIDEAQLFLPSSDDPYCKYVLREQWLRQGRQPGLSLVLATQQPSALDQEVFSHSDLLFCHRLTSQHDIQSLYHIRPSYMKENIDTIIKKMGFKKGVCAIIDDTMEQVHICRIRPRKSWHAGHEPTIGPDH